MWEGALHMGRKRTVTRLCWQPISGSYLWCLHSCSVIVHIDSLKADFLVNFHLIFFASALKVIVSFLHFKKCISQNADILIYNEKYNHRVAWILQLFDQHVLSLQANLSGKPNYHQRAAQWVWNQARGVGYKIWHSCAFYSLRQVALSSVDSLHGVGCLCPCYSLWLLIVPLGELLIKQDPGQPSPLKSLNFSR